MKQVILCFVLMGFSLLQTGCGIGKKAYGEPGKCEVHGVSLHKSIVRVHYGYYCAPGTHPGKDSETFPNARHPICGGCSVQSPYRRMYNCSECNKARRKYILSHAGTEKREKTKF